MDERVTAKDYQLIADRVLKNSKKKPKRARNKLGFFRSCKQGRYHRVEGYNNR